MIERNGRTGSAPSCWVSHDCHMTFWKVLTLSLPRLGEFDFRNSKQWNAVATDDDKPYNSNEINYIIGNESIFSNTYSEKVE